MKRKCLLNLNVILKEIKKLVTFNLPSGKCFSAKDHSIRNKPLTQPLLNNALTFQKSNQISKSTVALSGNNNVNTM